MLYMVQLHYRAEERDRLREHFERRGVTGHGAGVALLGAWVSASREGFVLLEASNEESLRPVCSELATFGEISSLPVISIDQIM
jgi:hypothetical protein